MNFQRRGKFHINIDKSKASCPWVIHHCGVDQDFFVRDWWIIRSKAPIVQSYFNQGEGHAKAWRVEIMGLARFEDGQCWFER